MSKIEEVAGILAARNGVDYGSAAPRLRRQFDKDACAAIKAMLGPTEQMLIDAGRMDNYMDGTGTDDADHIYWYDAMITAALVEK
ncbi:MAG: hypothetical protein KAI73_12525 [Rhodospirillaceae bacterium]|nr:hypothetical protein [Rhodospirillaceae bacterium]